MKYVLESCRRSFVYSLKKEGFSWAWLGIFVVSMTGTYFAAQALASWVLRNK